MDLTPGNMRSYETDGFFFSLENSLGREGSGGPTASAMEKGQREVWDGFIPGPQVPKEVLLSIMSLRRRGLQSWNGNTPIPVHPKGTHWQNWDLPLPPPDKRRKCKSLLPAHFPRKEGLFRIILVFLKFHCS